MTNFKLIVALTAIAFLTACQKQLSDPGTVSSSSNLLSKLIIKGSLIPQQAHIVELKYDNNNRVTRIFETVSDTSSGTLQTTTVVDLNFFYNGSAMNPYKYHYQDYPNTSLDDVYVFYNQAGLKIKDSMIDPPGYDITNYSYSGNALTNPIFYFNTGGMAGQYQEQDSIILNNGNLEKIYHFDPFNGTGIINSYEYNFGNGINPFSRLNVFNALMRNQELLPPDFFNISTYDRNLSVYSKYVSDYSIPSNFTEGRTDYVLRTDGLPVTGKFYNLNTPSLFVTYNFEYK